MNEPDNTGWPDEIPEYVIENPVRDLLNSEIDYSQNILGNLFIERGTYAVIQGSSSIGKSMLGVQMGIEAALGRETFGLKIDRPLRVLILQAEDSKNDRIRQNQCIGKLATTDAELTLIENNFRILTPLKRAQRGKKLFDFLTEHLSGHTVDLFILNPAFAFLDGQTAEDVGDFLREQLQEFLRRKNAAGIVIHHVPKPPRSGTGRTRAIETTMYSGHGSAEWANAPRASITIERTMASYVFEFNIGKRGAYSGWAANRDGYYTRYFTHSRGKVMIWSAATDQDIAAANTGIGDDDFDEVFRSDQPLTFEVIKARFRHYGCNYSDEELATILETLEERGKLIRAEEDGESVWRPLKSVKTAKKEAIHSRWMEEVFTIINEAGDAGIITTEIRKRFSASNNVCDDCLGKLLELGRIRVQGERSNAKRYFAVTIVIA
jgi:RecA-family ATPase